MSFIITLTLVIIISLITFLPAFNLALFGDDWLTFFRYLEYLGTSSHGHWNHFLYFLTGYGPQDIFMGLMYKIFGYQSYYYQLISYILRILASFSLYPIVHYLTKSRLAAFFSVLFFSVTPIGLDATNWVFNSPSYLSIAFFCLFLYFYIRLLEGNSKLFLPTYVLFTLTFITQPIRMHGLLPFVITLEIALILQNSISQKKISAIGIPKALSRIGIFLFILLFIGYLFIGKGPSGFPTFFSNPQNNMIIKSIEEGRFDIISIPVGIIGGFFFPDNLIQYNIAVIGSLGQAILLILSILILFIIITTIISSLIIKSGKPLILNYVFLVFGWALFEIVIYLNNQQLFSNSHYLILLTIGGAVLAYGINLLYLYINKKIFIGLFLALSWMLFAFFAAWMWGLIGSGLMTTTYRYAVVSAVGVSIFLSLIIGLGRNRRSRIVLFSLMSVVLILHLISTRVYLNKLSDMHNQQLTNKIWSQIPYIPEIGKTNTPLVFYFEGDQTNGDILHDVITFGFPVHIGLIYNIIDTNKIPIAMDSWKDVESAVSDGKSFKKHYARTIEPIPIDNVFVFKLEGKDNLINLTQQARQKLKQIE